MVFASPTLARICPLPWPTLLGFYWAKSLAPLLAGHCMVLGHIQQIRCRSNFAISSKPYQDYKVSYCLAYSDTSTRSSNMQSPPHDNSRGYSYQRHHQPSLPSTHSPNYMDHAAQPVGYHPVVQNAQVQRSTYVHPQDHHHPGMLLPFTQVISTHMKVNSIGRQQPRRSTNPSHHPTIRAIRESSIFPSAIHIRRSACERGVIEPGCPWPLSKLPSHRTRATYRPITTPTTLLQPAETLSKPKPSDADARRPRSIFEPRQGSHLAHRVWVPLPALFIVFFLASRLWRMWGHIHPSTRPQASL